MAICSPTQIILPRAILRVEGEQIAILPLQKGDNHYWMHMTLNSY